jgi:hypothetical protein
MRPARRRLAFLSAAVIAAIAAVLAAVLPASAVTRSAAGNGVGASHPGMILAVGVSHSVSAGECRCEAGPQSGFVSGACVAAEDTGASAAADAGGTAPTRIYSARALVRMAGGDSYHNFPESFNQTIFDQGTRSVVPDYFNKAAPLLSNDSVNYALPGSINGVEGEYQIFTRPSLSGNVEMIMHRFFMPY